MDDTTAALLAKHQRQMQRANQLYDRAEWKRAEADKIEQEVSLPNHLRPSGDETTRLLEAQLLRQEADALTREAEDVQRRLSLPAPKALKREVDDWIAERTPRRDRGDRER